MAPRVYHLHYKNKDVHNNKFKYELDDLKEFEKEIIEQAVEY
jgi:hypothetical protein